MPGAQVCKVLRQFVGFVGQNERFDGGANWNDRVMTAVNNAASDADQTPNLSRNSIYGVQRPFRWKVERVANFYLSHLYFQT